MSSGKNPLVLMMALSVPGAANALGLGEIHVDSALNERLAAQIDIVGATPLELADLRATVASRDIFQRYGADRPAFLSSATFKVTQDSQGRPVLTVRSTETFTEPLVEFLVDLRWHNGEIVRQYTLLLDPPGLPPVNRPAPASSAIALASAPSAPAAPDLPAVPPAARPLVETEIQTVARRADPPADQADATSAERAARKTTHIKVGAKATLRGIAWRVGERSESDLQRMMIAIFRANPQAFDGNINQLHRGAILTIPSHQEFAAISKAEAAHEVRGQMAAWRTLAQPASAEATPAVAAAAAPVPAGVAGETLDRRIQSLEQALGEIKGQMQTEHGELLGLQRLAASAEKSPPVAAVQAAPKTPTLPVAAPAIDTPQTAEPPNQSMAGYAVSASISAGLGLLTAALAGVYFRLRRRAPALKDSPEASAEDGVAPARDSTDGSEGQGPDFGATTTPAEMHDTPTGVPRNDGADVPAETQSDLADTHSEAAGAPVDADAETVALEQALTAAYLDEATHPLLPVVADGMPVTRGEAHSEPGVQTPPHEPTVNMQVDTVKMRGETRLDYNLLDLDLTAHHVHMPSVLNEHAVVKERRTNLADVLKQAIEREPDRHDLRMKLLELYYSAAATNRQSFLEAVQKFSRDRDHTMPAEQWDKIAYMGRQIAPENPLFAQETAAGEDLADCA